MSYQSTFLTLKSDEKHPMLGHACLLGGLVTKPYHSMKNNI